jgi:hypothetical protein
MLATAASAEFISRDIIIAMKIFFEGDFEGAFITKYTSRKTSIMNENM